MERNCWAARSFLLALLLGATLRARGAVGYYPRFSPFFFLCTHHGELEGDGEQGEVLISLHIAGNPTYYVPGQEYHGRYHGISALSARPGAPASAALSPFLLPKGHLNKNQDDPSLNIAFSGCSENKVSENRVASWVLFTTHSPSAYPRKELVPVRNV